MLNLPPATWAYHPDRVQYCTGATQFHRTVSRRRGIDPVVSLWHEDSSVFLECVEVYAFDVRLFFSVPPIGISDVLLNFRRTFEQNETRTPNTRITHADAANGTG